MEKQQRQQQARASRRIAGRTTRDPREASRQRGSNLPLNLGFGARRRILSGVRARPLILVSTPCEKHAPLLLFFRAASPVDEAASVQSLALPAYGVTRIRLVAGLLERNGAFLLAASRYPNLKEPLWHPPGGRPRAGELLEEALRREFAEETALAVEVQELLYVSESFDRAGNAHVLSATFAVTAKNEPKIPGDDAHVVDLAWVARDEALNRINVSVVREPLAAYLRGDRRRYYGFADAGITVRFADAE